MFFPFIVGLLFAIGGLALFEARGLRMTWSYFFFLWIICGLVAAGVADGVKKWRGKVDQKLHPPAIIPEEGISRTKPIPSDPGARDKALHEMLLRIAEGDVGAAAEVYRLGLLENDMVIFLASIMQLKDDVRRKILCKISSTPIEFRNTLLVYANKRARESKNNIIICIILLIVCCLGGIQAITTLSFDLGIPALVGIIFFSIGPFYINRNLRVANEIITTLKNAH